MTVLITGGSGFIGSNFIEYFLGKHQSIKIVNLDSLTYAGNLDNLKEISNNERYTFIKGNICDRKLIEKLFNQYNFEGVIHFAAESHVDNSIYSPDEFIKTNIFGTFNLLEASRSNWMGSPHRIKEAHRNSRFHHISTDEVYGSLDEKGLFSERTPYAPNSPYSASKASSDFLVRSYYHTYGLNVVTTNCSNNYGPKQHEEKLIPTIIRKAIKGENIPIYGKGTNVRDWLYVLDHCKGIDLAYHKGKKGETYNIGGDNEYRNIDIAETICDVLDTKIPKKESYKKQITFVEDRPGHDFRYAIDATKIKNELHWEAEENFKSGIDKTVDWYINKYKN
ncbi:MAG TPA: dTDP-glucose 4,6-dehydratase [Flavobacteriaceae bacterium]|nr:dTDP-glucose 4,6-dehydratase [Flavobacteriaceae bacterium]